jgi:hypothetical protein
MRPINRFCELHGELRESRLYTWLNAGTNVLVLIYLKKRSYIFLQVAYNDFD